MAPLDVAHLLSRLQDLTSTFSFHSPLSEKYTELNKILFKKIQMDDGKYGALERKGTMEGVSR